MSERVGGPGALPIRRPWFETDPVETGVTCLWEPYVDPFLESNVWHVRGAERDLVIDAGNGVGPLAPAMTTDDRQW